MPNNFDGPIDLKSPTSDRMKKSFIINNATAKSYEVNKKGILVRKSTFAEFFNKGANEVGKQKTLNFEARSIVPQIK